jgi:hypothetical protein
MKHSVSTVMQWANIYLSLTVAQTLPSLDSGFILTN